MQKKMPRGNGLLALMLFVGVLLRVVALGSFPSGINQDEAYSAYEAYCLLSDGMDSWGYRYPVYLTAWGSGMNALQSYLMLLLIRLFGFKTWVIRLPQALIACLSLPVMYALLKRFFGKRTALVGLGFLVICPWQITMARWGLESNLAPALVLMGLALFLKGMDDPRFYLASGVVYGLCLYAYATIWVVLPFMLLAHALYMAYTGTLKLSKGLAGGALALFALALPLLLFLLVNWGLLTEIVTPLFSIPRMPYMRSGEVSFSHLYENVYRLVKTFLLQRDDMVWNASDAFGLYYPISLPFIALGGILLFLRTVRSLRDRRFDFSVLVFIWLTLGILQGCVIDGNINRLNFLHFPLIFCAILGIDTVLRRWKKVGSVVLAAYALSFALFVPYYFTAFQKDLKRPYDAGLEEALSYAQSLTDDVITVSDSISYPKILFYAEIEPQVFRESAVWTGKPGAFMQLSSVERYRFTDEAPEGGVYILRADELEEGMAAERFDQIAVVDTDGNN